MSVARIGGKRGAGKGGSGNGTDGQQPPHPLVRAIEQLYAAGATPRLVIDSRRADVVVPEFLRVKWAERLVIDLDAAYPLDLAYDDVGVHASLAFSGVVSRCTFAWPSIYRIVDRADGRGIVVPAHEPATELAKELAYGGEARPVTEIVDAKKPGLSVVPPAETPKKEESASASDAEAKARRAKFRVIEGG